MQARPRRAHHRPCHANACDIGHIYELCQRDAECWQANVLLVEYPGYGTSPGNPYERSVDRHVMIAYDYLVSELKCKPESIILFGRSLGSGPVCRLALRLQELGERVGGIILHSPFISVKEVGLSLLGGVANIITDRWDNRKPLAAVACRTLIIHGASDEVVPFAHAEALRDVRKANGLHVTFFPTQGTHNYFSYYRDYLSPVENFLAGHASSRAPPLPDPLPLARYSRAQVREIMELRRNRTTGTTSSSSSASDAGDGVDGGRIRGREARVLADQHARRRRGTRERSHHFGGGRTRGGIKGRGDGGGGPSQGEVVPRRRARRVTGDVVDAGADAGSRRRRPAMGRRRRRDERAERGESVRHEDEDDGGVFGAMSGKTVRAIAFGLYV